MGVLNAAKVNADGSTNVIVISGGGGSSGTVAATAPGTTATTANPVQGVTGGVAVPISGTVTVTSSGSVATPSLTQLADGTTPAQKVAISAAGALKVDNSAVTQPVSNASLTNLQFDGSNSLKVNVITGATASNTVAATAAGTTATTANPVQGVTGGVPLPVSGTVTALPSVNGSVVSASNPLPTNYPIIGIGILTLLPTASVGTPPPLATVPTGAIGFRLYLPTGASVSGVFATSQANANTAAVVANGTVTYSNTATGAIADENLGAGLNFYVTAAAGAPLFRWI